MYKLIQNGIEKIVPVEEAEKLVAEHAKRNGYILIDEMWRTQEIIYLNDYCKPMSKEKITMSEHLENIIKNNDRYKDFTLLDYPVKFKDMQAGNDIEVVQLHSIVSCGENDIVGFCGVFSWINNTLTPLDHDSYSEETLVYGYNWFTDENGNNCLDILVEEW